MYENLKNKMYDYQAPPPPAAWDVIAASLDNGIAKTIPFTTKTNKNLYYTLAAAASIAIVVFSVFFWENTRSGKIKQAVSFMPFNKIPYQVANNYNLKKITEKDNRNGLLADNLQIKPTQQSDITKNLQQAIKENNIASDTNSKTYITIAGPEGQPVKISPKVATLIESSDNKYPPNAVWSSKINKWKEIMKANILTPTATNYLDIVELSNTFSEREN